MSPFGRLGLPRSASVAEVKKAYARLLKQNRPDDDPVAFQAIHQAYEFCLARARERAERQAQAVAIDPGSGRALSEASQDVAAPIHFNVEDEDFDDEFGDEFDDEFESADPDQASQAPETAAPEEGELPRRRPPLRPVLFPPEPPTALERRRALVLEPPMPAARLDALFEQMLAVVRNQGGSALARWLQDCEDFYSLQAKEQSAGPLIERLVQRVDELDLSTLQVLIEFFDLGGVRMDPRLRYLGQQLFDRKNFLRALDDIKRRHATSVDRLLWRELSSPRQPWRRGLLFIAPMMPGRLRALALQVLGADEDLALGVLDAQALDFWMPLTEPTELGWKSALSALAQVFSVVAPVIALVTWVAGEGLSLWAMLTGQLVFFGTAIWLVRRVVKVVSHRIGLRRLRLTGSMEQRAGGSVLQDPTSVIVLSVVALTLLICGLRALSWIAQAGSEWVMLLAMASLPFLVIYRRLRWEMALMLLLVSVAGSQGMSWLAPALDEPAANGASLSLCLAALTGVGVDWLQARREKIALPLARASFNPLALVIVLAALLAMAFMPSPSAPAATAAPVATELPARVSKVRFPDYLQDPRFASTSDAFAAVRERATPKQGSHSRFRQFFIPDGALRGLWIFSGGDLDSGPTRYAHALPPDARQAKAQLTLRCDDTEPACTKFRRENGSIKPDVDWSKFKPGGWRSFDSPGRDPVDCDCPAPSGKQTQADASKPATGAWIRLRLLFDERGRVEYVEEVESSGDAAFNKAAVNRAYAWKFKPGRWDGKPEGGVIERTIASE